MDVDYFKTFNRITVKQNLGYNYISVFTEECLFGIRECSCKLSFDQNKYKHEITDKLVEHLVINEQLTVKNKIGNTEVSKLVYASLGSGNLLSDLRILTRLLTNSSAKDQIQELELHLIDRGYNISKEMTPVENAKFIYLISYLQTISKVINVTLFIYQSLDDYLQLCQAAKNSESGSINQDLNLQEKEDHRVNVFTILDLGVGHDGIHPYNYQTLIPALQDQALVCFLGYCQAGVYYDVHIYNNSIFQPILVYDPNNNCIACLKEIRSDLRTTLNEFLTPTVILQILTLSYIMYRLS